MNTRERAPRGKGLWITSAWLSSIVLVLAGAVDVHATPIIQRYVNFSVSPSTLDLGPVPQPGVYDSTAELKVHVTANCVHAGVVASVTPLERVGGGGTIGRERVSVRRPATGDYVPMSMAVAATGPMNPGVFDIVLKFRVETTADDAAGEYAGTLTITCSAPP